MGPLNCEYCGIKNGLIEEHVCDVNILKSKIDSLVKESSEARETCDNIKASIRMFMKELYRSYLKNNEDSYLTVDKNHVDSLINNLNHKVGEKYDGYYFGPAHKEASIDCLYSKLICILFDLFESKEIEFDNLKKLYEHCLKIQEVFGYNDTVLNYPILSK